jgi:hypothetical protein
MTRAQPSTLFLLASNSISLLEKDTWYIPFSGTNVRGGQGKAQTDHPSSFDAGKKDNPSFIDLQERNIMNKFINLLSLFAAISLLVSGCDGRSIKSEQEQHAMSKEIVYETVLGKPVTDPAVIDLIATYDCSRVVQFQLCNEIGIALWINANQMVETVYLYLNTDQDVKPFSGELPYGLKFYDIQEGVEYKLKRQGIGNNGLPDEGSSPDHLHYWALYKQAGMTIIYNSPSAEDGDASIYAILVSK